MSADISLLRGGVPPHGTPALQDTGHFGIEWAAWINSVHKRVGVTLPNTGSAVSGLPSTGLIANPAVQDTRANRVKYDPGAYVGWLYYETDTGAFYISTLAYGGVVGTVPHWVFAYGTSQQIQANIPAAATLTAADSGLTVEVLDYNHKLRWQTETVTNAVWAAGSATLTITPLPLWIVGQTVIVEGILPAGFNGTVILTGVTATTITYVIANPGSAYVSGGFVSGYTWAAGDGGSGLGPVMFEVDPNPIIGWALYDGTNNVKYLKSDGTTGLVNLPDLVSVGANAAYLKAGSPDGGPNAAIAPTTTPAGTTALAATGITATVPAEDTGVESVTMAVSNAAPLTNLGPGLNHTHHLASIGVTVTDPTHKHNIVIKADGEPKNLVRRPWFRQ